MEFLLSFFWTIIIFRNSSLTFSFFSICIIDLYYNFYKCHSSNKGYLFMYIFFKNCEGSSGVFDYSAVFIIISAVFWLLLHGYCEDLMACVLSEPLCSELTWHSFFKPRCVPHPSAHWPSDNIDRCAPEFEHLVTSRCYTLSSPGVACVEWSNSRATESTQIYLTVSLHNSRSMTSLPFLQLCCNFENSWNAFLSTTIFVFLGSWNNVI